MNDIQKYILGLNLKDGDVIFVDAHMIDLDMLRDVDWPEGTPCTVIVPVVPILGRTLRDAVLHMTKEEIEAVA